MQPGEQSALPMKTLRLSFETGDVDMFSRNKKKKEQPEKYPHQVTGSRTAAQHKRTV